jgi:hypothetical protein
MSENPYAPPRRGAEWPRVLEADHLVGLRDEWRIGWGGDSFYFSRGDAIHTLDRATLARSAEVRMIAGDRVHLSLSQPARTSLALSHAIMTALRAWLGPHDAELRRRSLVSGWFAELTVGVLYVSLAWIGEPAAILVDVGVGGAFVAGGLIARFHPAPLGKYALALSWLPFIAMVIHDLATKTVGAWQLVLLPIAFFAVVRHWRVAQYFVADPTKSGGDTSS